jgi:hypothetical protein
MIEGIVTPWQDSEDNAAGTLRTSILQRHSLREKELKAPRKQPSLQAAEDKLLASNKALQRETSLTRESARVLLKRGAVASDGGFQFTRDQRMGIVPPFNHSSTMFEAFMKGVRCNAMYVLGDRGVRSMWDPERRTKEESQFSMLGASAASFECVAVPGRHHVHLNEPGVVAPHVNRFFQTHA